MAPDPADRYADTDGLKNDLVRFMRGGAEFPRTTFKAGTTIVREGERGNTAYIIVTGRCEVRKNLDRTFTVLQTLGPGDVFGEMAVLNETTRSATVTAIEDVTALVVSGDQLLREMATLKPWMASIMQRLASRLQDMYATRRVQTFVQSVPARRLATQIYMHLLAFGQHEADGRLHGVWSVVAKSIEDQLGVPATTIGVVMARYEGLLRVDTHADVIEIPRPGELARRLRSDD
jgi:serine/threonine-protein kinase